MARQFLEALEVKYDRIRDGIDPLNQAAYEAEASSLPSTGLARLKKYIKEYGGLQTSPEKKLASSEEGSFCHTSLPRLPFQNLHALGCTPQGAAPGKQYKQS